MTFRPDTSDGIGKNRLDLSELSDDIDSFAALRSMIGGEINALLATGLRYHTRPLIRAVRTLSGASAMVITIHDERPWGLWIAACRQFSRKTIRLILMDSSLWHLSEEVDR